MYSVELLEESLDAARRLGFAIREDWLGGNGGGACAVQGRKWLILDLNLSPRERLDQVLSALAGDPGLATLDISPALGRGVQLHRRRAA